MLGKKKNQVIRFEQNLCNAKVDDNEILFVRVNDIITSADARIEVPITHDAVLIKGGGDVRFYKSGTYNIFDDKKEVKNWKSGLSVEVIYISKTTYVPVKWGTPSRLRYRDKASNKVITIGAHGTVDIRVSNPQQFMEKVVGSKKEFNLAEFKKRFGLTVGNEYGNAFLEVVDEKNLTYDKFDNNRKLIWELVNKRLNERFEKEWGLSLINLETEEINLSADDMEAIETASAEKQKQEKLKEYLLELERLDDKQWEREKYLRQLELQDRAAYYEVLKVVNNHNTSDVKAQTSCPNCGMEYKDSDKFCPHCGKRVSKDPIICSACGKSNESTATFCSNCGKKLIGG